MTDYILFQKEVVQFIANLDKKTNLIEAIKKQKNLLNRMKNLIILNLGMHLI